MDIQKRKYFTEDDEDNCLKKPRNVAKLLNNQTQTSTDTEGQTKYPEGSKRQEVLDAALVAMIADDFQLLSVVEDTGFRHFVSLLDPKYSIPNRKKLCHMIEETCNEFVMLGMGGKGSPGPYPPRPRMPQQNSYQTYSTSQQATHYTTTTTGGVQQHQSQQQQPPSQQSQQQSQTPVLPQPPLPPQLPQPSPPPQPPKQPQAVQQQKHQVAPPPPPPPPQEPSPAPAVKNEPGTPAAGSQMEIDPDKANDGSEPKPKPWQKKRFPAFKVNKKLRKRKQNARLRKLLQPKNAMMVLHELKAGIKFTFQEHTNALTQTMFVVNAEVDGKVYVGQGLSKPVAKQNAAENALKALLLEKMSEAAMKAQKQDNAEIVEPMQQEVNNGAGSGDSGEGSDTEGAGAGAPGKPPAPEDDVPWGSLASFALYKLFTDWQNQGTNVPLPVLKQLPSLPQGGAPQPIPAVGAGAPSPMKKIPDNPTDRHPVMLLNQLKPGIQFIETSREGTPPNLTFTMSVTVDGKTYNGVAKNKKEAKKEAAIQCLAGSFDIRY